MVSRMPHVENCGCVHIRRSATDSLFENPSLVLDIRRGGMMPDFLSTREYECPCKLARQQESPSLSGFNLITACFHVCMLRLVHHTGAGLRDSLAVLHVILFQVSPAGSTDWKSARQLSHNPAASLALYLNPVSNMVGIPEVLFVS